MPPNSDEEGGKKPTCLTARCKRAFFGIFLCGSMFIFGFILIIVGGVNDKTAVVILGIVFFIGSIVFLFIICWTKRERLRQNLSCCLSCSENTEEKYVSNNTERDEQTINNSRTEKQKTHKNTTDGASFLDPGEDSKNKTIEVFELK